MANTNRNTAVAGGGGSSNRSHDKDSKSSPNGQSLHSEKSVMPSSTHSSVTPPPSSGRNQRSKPGAVDRQRVDEESAAKEKLRLLRTTPNELGLTLDDYNELLNCPAAEISNICSSIFKYSNTTNDHKSVMLDHLYVRCIHDLREFAQDEDTMKKLVDLFLNILIKIKNEPQLTYDIADLMGQTYLSLIYPQEVFKEEKLQELMEFYTETLLSKQSLIHHAFNAEIPPIFITRKFSMYLPSDNLFTETAIFPLAEAVPAIEIQLSRQQLPVVMLPIDPVNDNSHHYSADGEPLFLTEDKKLVDNAVLENVDIDKDKQDEPSEATINAVIQKVIGEKFGWFQEKIDQAIREREKLLASRLNDPKYLSLLKK